MNRIIYYDLVKTIAIFMVCFYHVNGLEKNILTSLDVSTLINYLLGSSLSICVTLFFMVNGALLLNKPIGNLKRHILKTIKLLLLTYLWAIIILLILIPLLGLEYTYKSFISSVWTLEPGKLNHLWFLMAMVSIYLVFPLIKLAYDQQGKSIFFYICIILFIFSFGNLALNSIVNVIQKLFGVIYLTNDHYQFFHKFKPFGRYAYALFYFSLGGYLALLIKEKKLQITNSLLIAIFIASLLLLFAYGCFMTLFHEKYYDTVWDGYFSLMTLAMSVTTFILASRILIKNKSLIQGISIIGENTLGIYLVHGLFGKLFKPYFHDSWLSQSIIANTIFTIIIIIIISLSMTLLIKKTPVASRLLKF